MNDADQHDGERDVKDRDRRRSRSFAENQPDPTAKLVPVKGSGLSGPFIRRPVMTMLLTLSVIVAGLATYGKLAVNDLPAVDYPVIQVSCSYPGADPTTMANNIATPLEKQFLQIPGGSTSSPAPAPKATRSSHCNLFLVKASRTPRPMCRPLSNGPPADCQSICRVRQHLLKRTQTTRRFTC